MDQNAYRPRYSEKGRVIQHLAAMREIVFEERKLRKSRHGTSFFMPFSPHSSLRKHWHRRSFVDARSRIRWSKKSQTTKKPMSALNGSLDERLQSFFSLRDFPVFLIDFKLDIARKNARQRTITF